MRLFPQGFELALAAVLVVIPVSGQRRNENQPGQPAANSAKLSAPQSSNSIREARQLFQKAAALFQVQHYSEAVPLLRQADVLAPGQASIHHYLGYALWKLDQWSRAQAEFEKAHQLDPHNPYTCYFLARTAQSLGQPRRAAAFYQDVLGLGPAIYDTDKRLGELYVDEGDLGEARELIETALRETPWDGSLYYELGRIDQKENHPAQAREELAAAGRLKNVDQTSIRKLLQLDEAVHRHQDALVRSLRAEVLASANQDPEIMDSTGVLLGKGGYYAQAVEPFEQAIHLAPKNFEPHFDLGLTLLKLGQTAAAEAQLDQALPLAPDSPEVNKLLAVMYVNQNQTQKAIERLRVANQVAPDDPRILALLGEQYLAGHYAAKAIPCLAEVIQRDPGNAAPYFLLIEAYQDQDNFQGALKVAQSGAARFPKNARLVYQEGQQLANIGNYQKARPYAEQAVELDPNLVDAYDLLGDILSKRGDYAGALTNFRKARNIKPTNKLALKGIAESLIGLNRSQAALTVLKQAIALQPEYDQLYFDLVQVYMRLGEREQAVQAEKMFQKLHASAVAERNAQAPRPFNEQ
jgi:tetratricopeptide (TPR) repeat protein